MATPGIRAGAFMNFFTLFIPGRQTKADSLYFLVLTSAVSPVFAELPVYDQTPETPVPFLLNDAIEEAPLNDIPLHRASP